MFNPDDIGWMQEVLDGIEGIEEVSTSSLQPVGPGRVISIPPRELWSEEVAYLPEHDYFEDDGQLPPEDEIDQVTVTAAFFIEDMQESGRKKFSAKDHDFEFLFRAYLHNGDYSYGRAVVTECLNRLREIRDV